MWIERLSQRAGYAVFIARISAGEVGSPVIDTEDLLLGILLLDPSLVQKSGGDLSAQELVAGFHQWRTPSPKLNTSQDLPVSDELGRMFERSILLADEMGSDKIQLAHLLLAMMVDPECHAAIALKNVGLDPETMRRMAIEPESQEPQTDKPPWYQELCSLFPNLDL